MINCQFGPGSPKVFREKLLSMGRFSFFHSYHANAISMTMFWPLVLVLLSEALVLAGVGCRRLPGLSLGGC